jgi:hypothetical protein
MTRAWWSVTQVGKHWAWSVGNPWNTNWGFYRDRNTAERRARALCELLQRTSSVEHPPVADSAEQRTPGTPDPPTRKDRST